LIQAAINSHDFSDVASDLYHLPKTLGKGKKSTTLFVTLQHIIKPVKTIKHLPGPADRKKQIGGIICLF
jgi:hypothetical protein